MTPQEMQAALEQVGRILREVQDRVIAAKVAAEHALLAINRAETGSEEEKKAAIELVKTLLKNIEGALS